MKKVLLVYEDYNEGLRTQTYLKKVGLDALEIGNEYLLSEQLLSFRPDTIVVCGGNAKKVSTLSVGQKLRDNQRFQGKVILIFPRGKLPSAVEVTKVKADQILEMPVDPAKLIQTLSRLMSLDEAVLLEKFSRTPFTAENASIHVGSAATKQDEKVRISKSEKINQYEHFLKDIKIDKDKTTYNSQSVKAAQKEFTKDWDDKKKQEVKELDQLKREFASAMFKKKGK